MTLGRRGLGGHGPATGTRSLFTRDRTDGGGGGGGGGGKDDADGKDDDDDTMDSEDDDESDEDDDDEDDDDEDDDEKLGPKGEKALRAVRKELREARRQLRELRAAKPKGKPKGKVKDEDDDEDDEPDDEVIEERARALAKPRLVRNEARTLLTDAGLIGKPDRMLRLLDLDEIDVEYDDDGEPEIDGLEDQIKELRRDYPQLFRKRGSSSIDAADRGRRDSGKKASASEIQGRALLGQLR